jgi:ABC-2 type transport system ATP-binding protein
LSEPLRVEGVSFSYYRDVMALRNVSLRVDQGEIVGLIGANGSGKSTLIKSVFDLLQIKSGDIRICGRGHREVEARRSALFLPSEDYLPEFLTGREYLRLVLRLYGEMLPDAELAEYFDRFSMRGRSTDLIEDYSHGMRKKVQLIAALLLRRPFTAIDETLNGIDLEALYLCEKYLQQMRDAGSSVLLCTHDFELLQRIANRVVLMAYGEVILDERVDTVIADHGSIHGLVTERLLGGDRV